MWTVINLHGVPLNVYTIFLPSSGTGYYRRRQNITRASLLCMPTCRSSSRTPIIKRLYIINSLKIRLDIFYTCIRSAFSAKTACYEYLRFLILLYTGGQMAVTHRVFPFSYVSYRRIRWITIYTPKWLLDIFFF